MAQPALPGTTKLRIKLKGLHTRAGCKGPAPAVKTSFQLQDLRAAVAEFSTKGANGLPGGVMMGAWNEEEVLQEQQYFMPSAPVVTQHLELPAKRVRKRRAAAATFDLVDKGLHYVVWGRSKRHRTHQPRRRPPAQLRDSLQRLLASDLKPSSRLATGTAPASAAAAEERESLQRQRQQQEQQMPAPVAQQQQEQVAVQDALQASQLKAVVQPVVQLQTDQPGASVVLQGAGGPSAAQPVLVPAHKQLRQDADEPMPQQQHLPTSDVQAAADDKQDQQQPATQVSLPRQAGGLQQLAAHRGEQAVLAADQQEGLLKPELQVVKQPSGQQVGGPEQEDHTMADSSSGGCQGPVAGGSQQQQQQQQAQLEGYSAGIQGSPAVEQHRQRVKKHKADALPGSAPSTKKARTSEQRAPVSAAAAAAMDTPANGRAVDAAAAASSEPAEPEHTAAATKAAARKQAAGPNRAAASAKAAPAAAPKPDALRQQTLATKAPSAGTAAVLSTKPGQSGKQAAAAKAAPAEAAPAATVEPEPSPEVQTAAAAKPESPPSETSHQQPIAASVPHHMQKLQPPLQPLAPQMPQEQTAVSRDRSQCSLQQPAESPAASAGAAGTITAGSPASAAAAAAAAMRGYSVHSASGLAAGGPKRHLLELEASAMSPAALALGSMQVPTVSFRQVLPDRLFGSQVEAGQYLDSMLVEARKKKHMGDNRSKQQNGWDVHSLTYYAYSALEFLRYWDACHKALKQLTDAGKPCEFLKMRNQQLTHMGLLKQVSHLCSTALQNASNCKGQDVQKQALRMLLERLCAICQLKHLHSQKDALQHHANLLKGTIPMPSSHNGSGSNKGQQQQGQRVVSGKPPTRAVAAATAAAAVGGSSGSSPTALGKQAFDKRSPDDSNTSNQDRVQLSGMLGPEQQSPGRANGGSPGGNAAGGNGAGGGAAASERMLMVAESTCAEHLGDLLKITDGMHQTVMRMQQFLESPEVLADEDARAAALHISMLGLDAGMFSIPRVVAHAEAALVRVVRSGRRGMVRMAS